MQTASHLVAVWMLHALWLRGCSPTTADKPPLTGALGDPQRMRSLRVCLAVYNADTLYPSSQQTLPSQSAHAGAALPVKPRAAASSPQKQGKWGDAGGRESLSVSFWVSNWVKRSLTVRSDSVTCQFLLCIFFSKAMTSPW